MSREAALAMAVSRQANIPVAPPVVAKPDSVEIPAADHIESEVLDGAAKPAETKTDDLQSSRLAILAKKEAAILREREAIKKDREEFVKQKEESDRYLQKGREFDETFKRDKIAALRMIGYSDTDIVNIVTEISDKQTDPIEEARKIAKESEERIREDIKKEKDEVEARENARLIGKLKSNISDSIKKEAEKFEYCSYYGAEAEAQAYHFIVEDLKENQDDPTYKMLTPEEAIELCESYYEERDKDMAKLKKRQPKAEEPVVVEEKKPTERTRTVVFKDKEPEQAPVVKAAPRPSSNIPTRESIEQRKARIKAEAAAGKFALNRTA